MSAEWIGKLMEFAKLPTRFIAVVFTVSLLLKALPDNAIAVLGVQKLVQDQSQVIGLVLLISGAMPLTEGVFWLVARNSYEKAKQEREDMAFVRLQSLDPSEKAVLREFFLQGRHTLKLPFDHPIVAGLITAGILVMISNQGRVTLAGTVVSMKVNEDVRQHISSSTIDLPVDPSESQIQWLRENRPNFIDTILRDEEMLGGWCTPSAPCGPNSLIA